MSTDIGTVLILAGLAILGGLMGFALGVDSVDYPIPVEYSIVVSDIDTIQVKLTSDEIIRLKDTAHIMILKRVRDAVHSPGSEK